MPLNYCRRCKEHTQPKPERKNRCGRCGCAYHHFYRPPDEIWEKMESRPIVVKPEVRRRF